jgi:hypothetical protein
MRELFLYPTNSATWVLIYGNQEFFKWKQDIEKAYSSIRVLPGDFHIKRKALETLLEIYEPAGFKHFFEAIGVHKTLIKSTRFLKHTNLSSKVIVPFCWPSCKTSKKAQDWDW